MMDDKVVDIEYELTEDARSKVTIEDLQEVDENDERIVSIHCQGGCTTEEKPTAVGCMISIWSVACQEEISC